MLLGPVAGRPVNHPLVPPLQAPEPSAAPSLAPAQTRWSFSHCRLQSQRPFAHIWPVMRLLTSWPHSSPSEQPGTSPYGSVLPRCSACLASICLDCSHSSCKSALLVFLASGCRLTSSFVFARNAFSVWSGVVGAPQEPGFFADFLVFPLSCLSAPQVGCPVEAFLLYTQLNTRWQPNHRLLLDEPRLLT